jgi:mannitol/fructose-specific phosphotransferase system IIA component (Ntr-type)
VKFIDHLAPARIAVAPPWRTFDETVTGLVDLLVADGALPAARRAAAVAAVTAREAQASTALLDVGVGVPHARLAGLARAVVALAIGPTGLYEAVPAVPIYIVALVLSPPSAADEHLRLLAGIATRLRSSALRAALLRAPEPARVLAVLRADRGGARP